MKSSVLLFTALMFSFVSQSQEQLLLSKLKLERVNILQQNNKDNTLQKPSTCFMMDLYRELQTGSSLVQAAGRGNLNLVDLSLSDTIRTFAPKEIQDLNAEPPHLHFDVPVISREDLLRIADIRLKGKQDDVTMKKNTMMTISIIKGSRTLKQVTTRRVSERKKGYFVFDISRVLSPLVNRFHGNLTINITFPEMKENDRRGFTYMLNLYTENHNFITNILKVQHRNSSDEIKSRNKRSVRKNQRQRKNKRVRKAGKRRSCQLYDFEVNFNTIGLGDWIIHPTRFNAKFCQGRCSSPIDIRHKPTNHAMLQSLMRSKQSKLIPAPCCVPTKLEPLSVMYIEYDEVVVRHHVDMIATECGCR